MIICVVCLYAKLSDIIISVTLNTLTYFE